MLLPYVERKSRHLIGTTIPLMSNVSDHKEQTTITLMSTEVETSHTRKTKKQNIKKKLNKKGKTFNKTKNDKFN